MKSKLLTLLFLLTFGLGSASAMACHRPLVVPYGYFPPYAPGPGYCPGYYPGPGYYPPYVPGPGFYPPYGPGPGFYPRYY